MRVLLVTQNDYFLINRHSIELLQNLISLGVQTDVLLTPASSHGKKASTRDNVTKVASTFGWLFLTGVLARTIKGYFSCNLRKWCRRNDVRIIDLGFENINATEFVNGLARSGYDSALILAGNRIIKRNFLDAFGGNVVNVHSSLLPYSKGLMPAFWTLKEKRGMGVTLFRLSEGIDDGEIISQVPLVDSAGMTLIEYFHQTKRVGINLLLCYVLNRLSVSSSDIEDCYNKYPTREAVEEFNRSHRLL